MSTVLPPNQANLTVREMEVIRQLCLGKSNKQIAWDMSITERTVKAHLTSIFAKTGTKNRVHLVLLHLQSLAGNRPAPSLDELIAELPTIN